VGALRPTTEASPLVRRLEQLCAVRGVAVWAASLLMVVVVVVVVVVVATAPAIAAETRFLHDEARTAGVGSGRVSVEGALATTTLFHNPSGEEIGTVSVDRACRSSRRRRRASA